MSVKVSHTPPWIHIFPSFTQCHDEKTSFGLFPILLMWIPILVQLVDQWKNAGQCASLGQIDSVIIYSCCSKLWCGMHKKIFWIMFCLLFCDERGLNLEALEKKRCKSTIKWIIYNSCTIFHMASDAVWLMNRLKSLFSDNLLLQWAVNHCKQIFESVSYQFSTLLYVLQK